MVLGYILGWSRPCPAPCQSQHPAGQPLSQTDRSHTAPFTLASDPTDYQMSVIFGPNEQYPFREEAKFKAGALSARTPCKESESNMTGIERQSERRSPKATYESSLKT